MNTRIQAIGGAAVGVLSRLEAWEANLVLNLRLWTSGHSGQSDVWNEYRRSLPDQEAQQECGAFEALLSTIMRHAQRPLMRHDVSCACVGADEAVFANLVRTAPDGHLTDAALISTLLVGPAYAEHLAMLAGQVGECMRRIHPAIPRISSTTAAPTNVVRLH